MDAELRLLGRSSELTIEAPDSGCCGMAGAFGYGANRFELSRTIGERVLFPAIRRTSPETTIIADGFACRAQIRQFCPDRNPVHLAEVLSNPNSGPGTIEVAYDAFGNHYPT
jgi:Fe-S oxidoreductase